MDRADIGLIFASSRELAGFYDLLPKPQITLANGLKYRILTLQDRMIVSVESGYEEKKIINAVRSLIEVFSPRLLMSAGFANALSSKYHLYDLCYPDRFVRHDNGLSLDRKPQRLFTSESVPSSQTDSRGPLFVNMERTDPLETKISELLTGGTILYDESRLPSREERESWNREFGAELQDRESWPVLYVAQERKIPFLSVRVVRTLFSEELPMDIQTVEQSSEISSSRFLGSLFGMLIKQPKGLIQVWNSKEKDLIASDTLGKELSRLLK